MTRSPILPSRCAGRRPSRVSARCRSSPSISTKAWESTPTRSRPDRLRLGQLRTWGATRRTRRRRPPTADDHDAHPPLDARPRLHDLRGQRPGPRLNAQPNSLSEQGGDPRVISTADPVVAGPAGGLIAEPGDHAAPRRRHAGTRRPRLRAGPGAAHLLGALHRRRRLRRDLPPGRSAVHDRSVGSHGAEGPRRARAARLLGLPASDRPRPPARRRPGRDARGPDQGRAGLALRRRDPAIPSCWPSTLGVVAGRVRQPRLPPGPRASRRAAGPGSTWRRRVAARARSR